MSRTAATHLDPEVGSFLLAQRHRGACTEQTAGLFFDDGRPTGRGSKSRHEAAKAICRLCPILEACRAYAHADLTLEGVWDGETQDERRIARRRASATGLPANGNEEGRRLAGWAAERARRDGLDVAARALKVPAATLRRVLDLYGLDQPPSPANPSAAPRGGEHPWQSPRRSPVTATASRQRSRRSRSSSPSRAGPSPGLAAPARQTTPATRPPDQPPIPQESPSWPAQAKERT
jgi:WhiB family redox-sensing transcriptional regulator